MRNKQEGLSQEVAAAKAGISERTGYSIDKNNIQKGRKHDWKTRKDPFEDIWEKEIIPMLKDGIFESTFILQILQQKYPDKYEYKTLRTLQKKVKKWKALCGPEKEVMFLQKHEPGELAISDFTHPNRIKVTINGEPLEHIFYRFRLVYSGFNYVQVFRGSGEPYEAFTQGLQEALYCAGGVPVKHRTDSLSASFKNLNKEAKEDLTERYKAFIEHFNMEPTRNNRGEAHENGSIEASHTHFKNRVYQHLIIRQSIDFKSFEDYREFIQTVSKEHNKRVCKNFKIEQASLKPLPVTKAVDYKEAVAVVSSSSTINVRRVTYTVPSRLIGERLHVRLYAEKIEGYLGIALTCTMTRKYTSGNIKRIRQVDYRHVIGSLIKKPGAFYSSKLRDDLLPNDSYRFIWEHVSTNMIRQNACKFIVGLLHLAATQNCEDKLAEKVVELIQNEKQLKLTELQHQFTLHKTIMPELQVSQHDLSAYNKFIPNLQEACL